MNVGQALVGLAQVLGGGRAARQRLDLAEVEQEPEPAFWRRRLVQRALQVAGGVVDRAAPERRHPRLVQQLRHLRVSAPRRVHQLARDLVQRGAGAAQHAGRAGVQELALPQRQALVDGVADERVHEPGRRFRAQDLGAGERGHRAGDLRLVEPRDTGDRRQVRSLPQHRDRAGDARRLAGQPGEPQQDGARDRARPDRPHHVGVGGIGLDRVGFERVQQLPDEQRVAAGGRVAGRAEGAVGFGTEPARDERADRLLRERAGAHVGGGGIVGDLGQQRGVGGRVAGAHGRGDEHRLALQAAHEVGEEAQARAVAPVQVVDLEQQRVLGGEVERQPVQAVQGGEGRVAACGRAVLGALEDHARGRGGSREHVGIADDALEELADDAERELALQLARAGVEDERAVGDRAAPELGHQARLADPRRALDQHGAALALDRLLEQRVQQRDLAVALDQRSRGLRLDDPRHGRSGLARHGGVIAQELLVQRDERRRRASCRAPRAAGCGCPRRRAAPR